MSVEAAPAPEMIEVVPDKALLVERAYEFVIRNLKQALSERDVATIALSGGSTPKPLYEKLAQADLPWDKIHIFWGDERYVAADHPDSNYLMTRLAWLDHVTFPAVNIHPVPTDTSDPLVSAQQYGQELQEFFQLTPQDWPQFDVMLLGMGDDAHTASLFPETAALSVSDQWVTVGEKSGTPRVTLTVPVINHARFILFMVAGANKQTALSQVFAPVADDLQYPSRLIRSTTNNLVWLLDQAAAEGIPNTIEMLYPYRSS